MKSYAQNKEDLFIADYFGDFKGTLLDCGANDGITFSNSRLLIELGWKACVFEPGYLVGEKLVKLYNDNPEVRVFTYGLGAKTEEKTFWESGPHIPGGSDHGLVSTFDEKELERWPDVIFHPYTLRIRSFKEWEEANHVYAPFDFISVDCEGMDFEILQQIDLTHTKCLIIEHNGDEGLKTDYCRYCVDKYGMKVALVNAENIIFIK